MRVYAYSDFIPLDVEASDTIDSVKAQIQNLTGIPSDQQTFTFKGAHLTGSLLSHNHIQHHSALWLTGVHHSEKGAGKGKKGEEPKVDQPQAAQPVKYTTGMQPMGMLGMRPMGETPIEPTGMMGMQEQPKIDQPIGSDTIMHDDLAEPNVETPQVEAPAAESWLAPLLAYAPPRPLPLIAFSIHFETPLPKWEDPFCEAVLACERGDLEHVLHMLELEGRRDLLLDPRLWHKFAPMPRTQRSAPPWFPGSKSQYSTYRRMVGGAGTSCPMVRALFQFLDTEESPSSATAALLDEQTETICDHVSDELSARFGPKPDEHESPQATKRRLKLQLQACDALIADDKEKEKRKRTEEKKRKQEKAAANAEAKGAKRRKVP